MCYNNNEEVAIKEAIQDLPEEDAHLLLVRDFDLDMYEINDMISRYCRAAA